MLIAKFPDMFAQTELNWYHYCLPSMHRWFFVDIDGKQQECWITLSKGSYFCILKTHFDINSSTQQTSLSRDLCVYAVSVYVCVCVCVCACVCVRQTSPVCECSRSGCRHIVGSSLSLRRSTGSPRRCTWICFFNQKHQYLYNGSDCNGVESLPV